MTSSKFRPPSPPDAAVNGDFDLKEGEEEEEEGSGGVDVAAAEEVRPRESVRRSVSPPWGGGRARPWRGLSSDLGAARCVTADRSSSPLHTALLCHGSTLLFESASLFGVPVFDFTVPPGGKGRQPGPKGRNPAPPVPYIEQPSCNMYRTNTLHTSYITIKSTHKRWCNRALTH